jgi:hypothetical protein
MSFSNLKKNRSNSLQKLSEQLDKLASNKSYADPLKEKYWNPTKDAAGNGFAIIRFLPALEDGDMPFIKTFDHGFQGPTGLWYIENSLNTLGKEDPVAKLNSKLWNSNKDNESPERKQASKQKRRTKFHSNILVIKDPAKPENEGKVFLFSYGKKIFDKLNDLMNPQFEDETPVNPFDFWEGANFKLKMRQVEGYTNYDKSEFETPSALFDGDDEKLEEVYNKIYDLKELHDPKYFKSYDELEAKLYRVLGITGSVSSSKTADEMIDEDLDMSKYSGTSSPKEMKSVSNVVSDDEEDEDLSFFRELANK